MKVKISLIFAFILIYTAVLWGCGKAENPDAESKETTASFATTYLAETTASVCTETLPAEQDTTGIANNVVSTDNVADGTDLSEPSSTVSVTGATDYYEEAELDFSEFE